MSPNYLFKLTHQQPLQHNHDRNVLLQVIATKNVNGYHCTYIRTKVRSINCLRKVAFHNGGDIKFVNLTNSEMMIQTTGLLLLTDYDMKKRIKWFDRTFGAPKHLLNSNHSNRSCITLDLSDCHAKSDANTDVSKES